MKRVEVKKGERYGRLTIIREVEPAGSSHKRVRRFLCRCDCWLAAPDVMFVGLQALFQNKIAKDILA